MCLSTAYANSRSADTVMANNVTSIGFDGSDIVLTDLMGAEIRVTGALTLVDLINGIVIIDTQE